ncbi:thioredoxin family protein [Pseudomonas sp. S31]|uniref:thioredoxin family protein n=1 Tax=Pseudomonas sp. S31 TaxID=1564473 RepID=UPI001912A3FA|nr:thioredoxin domain-containing protein [Pseudomonas sp. S31]
MAAPLFDVNVSEFDTEVLDAGLPVLIDFWAPWCGPCRALEPLIQHVADEFDGRVKVVKINIDEAMGLAHKFGVRSVPTLVLVNGQDVLGAIVSPSRTRVYGLLDEHLA